MKKPVKGDLVRCTYKGFIPSYKANFLGLFIDSKHEPIYKGSSAYFDFYVIYDIENQKLITPSQSTIEFEIITKGIQWESELLEKKVLSQET